MASLDLPSCLESVIYRNKNIQKLRTIPIIGELLTIRNQLIEFYVDKIYVGKVSVHGHEAQYF